MNSENFCFWLQGFFELKKTIDCREGATAETLQVIEDHLKLVFDKKTPDRTDYKNLSYEEILEGLGRKPVDLVGKQFEWMIKPFDPMNPPAITC